LLPGLGAACGPKEPPSEADARRLFETKLRGPIERGEMRVKSFTWLGGANLEDGRYNVDYRAEVECLKGYEGGSMTATVTVEAQKGYISFKHDRQGPQVVCTAMFQRDVPHASLTFRKASGTWQGEK
jgi:hypothetical protein